MKKYAYLLASLCFSFLPTIACSTFFINSNGELVFGRNYDWVTGTGTICTNLKGLAKTSLKMEDGNTIDWTSKYGSITFNQYGKEFPTGGMNEKGLVVELMWLDGTTYPAKDNRAALTALQWIQYQLDNCANIHEVIETDKRVRISVHNAPLHFLIADADGNAATIEFFSGKIIIHTGKGLPFPVLTNNSYHVSKLAATSDPESPDFHLRENSLVRFTKACSMVKSYEQNKISKPALDYAFDILQDVAQGDFTKWSIVYDIKNKKIYFKTAGCNDTRSFGFSSFNFNCRSVSKMVDINKPLKGDISKNFEPFDIALNRKLTEKAFEESRERVNVSKSRREAVVNYSRNINCSN